MFAVKILTLFIALEHIFIFYFEVFKWETLGKKIFKSLPEDVFKPTKVLAANQGVYNLFLAVGLLWGLVTKGELCSQNILLFFLICVVIAGIFGGATVSKRIYFVQAAPALITLILLLLG